MNANYIKGFLKRANEAGVDPQMAQALLQQVAAAQGGQPQDPSAGGAGIEDPAQTIESAGDQALAQGAGQEQGGIAGKPDEAQIHELAKLIAAQLVQEQAGGQQPSPEQELAKASAWKDNADYIEGFLKASCDTGYDLATSYQIFKQAFDSSVAQPEVTMDEKTASEYWTGVFEKAAEYGFSREEVLAIVNK